MSSVPPPPGASFGAPTGATPPPNYLVWSILTTLFCCLPAGIVSIIFAAQVNSKFAAGDYAAAESASNNAKRWAIISAVVGLIAVPIVVGLQIAAGSSGS